MTIRWREHCRVNFEKALNAHAYPVSPELSLRAKRGNLVKISDVVAGTRSPRRSAPGDDKLGTRQERNELDSIGVFGVSQWLAVGDHGPAFVRRPWQPFRVAELSGLEIVVPAFADIAVSV